MKLFRITTKANNVFAKAKGSTFYISMRTKEEAEEYLKKHLHDDYSISSTSCVADEQNSGIMWSRIRR
jgi:hypothetical protein